MVTHKDLDVWKIGIELIKQVYEITNLFPNEETYGLISQMRRSAISIPSNISEGAARNSKKEFIQFLYISLGSLAELETQMVISTELGYIPQNSQIFSQIELLRRKLLNFIKYLKNKQKIKREAYE
ncbi:MAG: 23S rRNA-intervening sequence protein [Candidatus Methanoperedenaceae archaeon GB50]|nr:MAG: 23S rRNA-intervening sequence protein [Candidatus Methanoperedenaceae archaeon GB50]